MKKILIIEDNSDLLSNTAEILEISNYKVLVAENGKIGVERALEERPDLIVCDILMPVLDGYGVLDAIRRNESIKNTPFIFLSAKTERSEIRKGMDAGADDYLTKPFDATELLNAVSTRLKKSELLKTNVKDGVTGVHQLLRLTSGKEELEMLTKGLNIYAYKKKQVVYTQGNHPNQLYYVMNGKVRAYKTNEDGKEFVTELFNAGDFVGHIALLEKTAYKDTVEAMEESELAIVPKEDFDELIDNCPEVAKRFIQLLARNIFEKESQLLKLAYNSMRKKVADVLIMVQLKFQRTMEGNFAIDISRENLATIVGTATESLIQTLNDFKNERLIDIENGKIRIINQKKLEDLVN